jgi:lipopolysaccharide export system permease protein
MNTLTKYFYKEFSKLLVVCLFILVSMFIMVDLIERVDNLIEANVPRNIMVSYFAYKLPFILVQMLPPATLIAVIIMFSLMKKNNEITALMTSGVNVLKFSRPVIIASIPLAIGLFIFSEIIVPFTSSKSNEIWRVHVNKQAPDRSYARDHVWYKGANAIYWIRHFDNKKMVMTDPILYFFDSSFRLVKRIDARLGIWRGDKWEFREGLLLQALDDGDYRSTPFERMDLKLPEAPGIFVREAKGPEEMSYWQLRRFANRVRQEGYDATRYFVDLNIKLSFPFIVLIMVLIGIPIALRQKKGGITVALASGVALCFMYLLVLGVSRSLGFAGFLPSILSAWLANGVFFFLGIYLMMNVNR